MKRNTTSRRDNSHKLGRAAQLESLELRKLLSGTPFQINGTSGDDVIQINAGSGGASGMLNGVETSYSFDWADGLEVHGGDGNDTIDYYGFDHDVSVHGDAGNDDILIFDAHATGYYFGDAGDDNFRVYRSSATQRIFSGGDGTDTVDWSAFSNEWWPVNVSLDGVANDGSPTEIDNYSHRPDNVLPDIERIIGTPGPDTITGTANDETILAGAGDDIIDGGGGNDFVDAGDGNNVVTNTQPAPATPTPTPVTDTTGSSSSNNQDGSTGSQVVAETAQYSLDGNVLMLTGTSGNDQLTIRSSSRKGYLDVIADGHTLKRVRTSAVKRVELSAGDGNDTVRLDTISIPSSISGGAGDDVIYGSRAPDTISGGDGNDWINSGQGNDHVTGDAGDDRLFGDAGKDYLSAGTGYDVLRGGSGKDSIVLRSKKSANYRGNRGDRIVFALL
jgi:Ca2+-binding RTX toxin-like protein